MSRRAGTAVVRKMRVFVLIEISERLSYQTILGISHVDWGDVESMHFKHYAIYGSDEYEDELAYSSYLIITLATGKRLRILIEDEKAIERMLKASGHWLPGAPPQAD